MDLFNRLIVTLLGALLAAGGALALALLSGWPGAAALNQAPGLIPIAGWLHALPAATSLWTAAGSCVGGVVGITLMALELRAPANAIVIVRDKSGSVSVSLAGLRRLADYVASEVPGVEAVVSDARRGGQGVSFRCRVVVSPEACTPELAQELRTRLGAAVKNHIGQPAANTRIDVQAHIETPSGLKKRVR